MNTGSTGRRAYIARKELAVNHDIEAEEVRVIGSDGEQIGVLPLAQAIDRAGEAGLDLVLISPNAKPPVCKIMDY
ncbi:MAG: translation initiation factor IF-3, partial [Mariprofundaceae bacterium]|nr:translation initiation factor IF-3 [Mariprofundaceae bacterium]